jgi:general nucleoside transport system ATP-binding protein
LFENLALHGAGAARGVMSWPMIRQRTREVLARFDVRADSERSSARALSGGNQQRFVLGRELESRPALLVAEHPTRGLDLVATRAIHSHLRAAAGEGAVVVVHSGDLDELLELSDRVLVVHAARVRELPVVREIVARGMVGD